MKPHVALLIAVLGIAMDAHSQSSSQTLVWDDEFNQAVGSSPDSTKWAFALGTGNPVGWGNNELETYTNAQANCSVVADPDATDGKALAITAIAGSSGYTSARLNTQGIYNVTYGLIEARMKLPAGQGLWPAFWMLGSDISTVSWPQCGEIDIMENLGQNTNKMYGTLHGPGYSGSNGIQGSYALASGAGFNQGYHVFAVLWKPGQIQWSVDGNVYQTLTTASIPAGAQWVFDNEPFFILMNLAVGGNWPGSPNSTTVFPQTLYVDYVRVYSLAATQASAPSKVAGYASPTGQVLLTWTAPSGSVAGYQVVRATDSGFTQGVTTVTLGPATSYSDTSVSPGVTYYYSVSTVTAAGTSAPTAAVAVSTPSGSPAAGTSGLVNVSTRCLVGTGASIAIAGVVVNGTAPSTLLFRAVGPGLAAYSVPGWIADPELDVFDGTGKLVATNAGWGSNANATDIEAAFGKTGAFALASGSADSALLLTLAPGAYTAEVSGESGDTGVALIEAYSVQ